MKISTPKTEVMTLSREATECTLHVYRAQLHQVEFFKYLGILSSSDGTQNREIDRRINQASLVAREFWNTVIGNARLSRGAKLSIYRSLFKSTLTYGLETWIL